MSAGVGKDKGCSNGVPWILCVPLSGCKGLSNSVWTCERGMVRKILETRPSLVRSVKGEKREGHVRTKVDGSRKQFPPFPDQVSLVEQEH